MKRITAVFISFCLLLLGGCTADVNNKTSEKRLKVAATIFPPYDFCREIAGDSAEITMLMPTGSESHDYEPTLKNIDTVSKCDVFVYVGGGTDKWAESLLEAVPDKKRTVICLTDLVPVIHLDEHDEHEHHHHEGKEIDEHIWTLPKNVETVSGVIADTFAELDKENAAKYHSNYEVYREKLAALESEIENITEKASFDTLCFADRFPFKYLAEGYGLNYIAAIDGCESDAEPTLSALSEVIDCLNSKKLPAVLYTESADGKIVKKIAEFTGVKSYMMYSCHGISKEQLESGETFLSLMRHNVQVLREALNK